MFVVSIEIFQLVENLVLVLVLGILMLAPLGNESMDHRGTPRGTPAVPDTCCDGFAEAKH